MWIAREHDEEVFIVLARNHRVQPVDASGKKCHPLILDRSAIQSEYTKIQKIPGFHQLGENNASVVGGIGGVVERRSVVIDKADKAGVFNAIALIRGNREYNSLAHREVGREAKFVITLGQPVHAFEG